MTAPYIPDYSHNTVLEKLKALITGMAPERQPSVSGTAERNVKTFGGEGLHYWTDATGKPKPVALGPWADSINTAMGQSPNTVRYAPDYAETNVMGSVSPQTRNVRINPTLSLADQRGTYAHEMAHLNEIAPNATHLDSPRMNKEDYAELARLGWEYWSGRPVQQQSDPRSRQWTIDDIRRSALQYEQMYNKNKLPPKSL
jgi:hypothetical protein